MPCHIECTTVATIVGLKSELEITKDDPNFTLTFENRSAKYQVAKQIVISRDFICTCSQSFEYSHVLPWFLWVHIPIFVGMATLTLGQQPRRIWQKSIDACIYTFCQIIIWPIRGHVSYPTSSPTATRLGLRLPRSQCGHTATRWAL